MLLLDTCCLLWMADDQARLSDTARDRLRSNAGALFLSAISAFEIGIKHRKASLVLPQEPTRWIERALELHGVREVPVDWRIALASTELPALHADPCDRIIVATALALDMTVLTPDPLIRAYPHVRVAW